MSIEQKFTGDAAQLMGEVEKLRKALIRVEEQNNKASKNSLEAQRQNSAAVREGVRLQEKLATATESVGDRHQRLGESLKAAWSAGQITTQQYTAGLDQLQVQYGLVGGSARKVATDNDTAFGAGQLSSIVKFGAGLLTVKSAADSITQAFMEWREEREKGVGETVDLKDSRRRLLQVSKSSDDFQAMEKRADDAAGTFGVDRDAARQILFRSRSEGFEKDYEDVVKLNPVIDPEAAATIAGKIRQLFSKENLSVEEAVSSVVVGAESSDADIAAVSRSLPIAGEGGRQIGAKLAETTATLATLSPVFKSTEGAAERLKILQSKMALEKETSGRGLIGGFEALQAQPEEFREKFLGENSELRSAYAAMSEALPTIKTRTVEIEQAQKRNVAGERVSIAYSDDKILQERLAAANSMQRSTAAEGAYSSQESKNKQFRDWFESKVSKGETVGGESTGGVIGSINNFGFRRIMDAAESSGSDIESAVGASHPAWLEFQKEQTELLKKISEDLRGNGGRGPSPNVRNQTRNQEGLGGADQ